jgi:hypothetical protein
VSIDPIRAISEPNALAFRERSARNAAGPQLAEHGTPSAADLQVEAADRAAPGQRKWSMGESIDLVMTDAFEGMPP